ncbi:hypothetical protein RhiirA5_495278 [Rhizophagus irregularis]|uniref:Uncharacterized protein n=1 Tax=Rhizophagus irregularis TaxID=588596 RepID=A0A2I1E9B1_9GLOM|nr:hypothetical protein RhiirA5_501586 [Rhizophagus irregularis]PKC14567.1 hypothetical protein RhiirA5_495278 [Rhizophagus irregularis]PKC75175.1 hypothetical protein RhiirA1_528990 [Rhizophagus irregularis]PKY18725.1 hypothetical protein RhiirB3_522977 [Rhizophagus irregularis]
MPVYCFYYCVIYLDIWVNELKWLPNNQVLISLHGPPTDKCIQQGIEIVSDFKFYILNKVPYILWNERRWINGYTENNISGGRDGKDCSKLYEGAVDHELTSTYDPNEFASPGQKVALEMWLYGNCRYKEFLTTNTHNLQQFSILLNENLFANSESGNLFKLSCDATRSICLQIIPEKKSLPKYAKGQFDALIRKGQEHL